MPERLPLSSHPLALDLANTETGYARADDRLDDHCSPAPAREVERTVHDLREPRPRLWARDLLERVRVVDIPLSARLDRLPPCVCGSGRLHGGASGSGLADVFRGNYVAAVATAVAVGGTNAGLNEW